VPRLELARQNDPDAAGLAAEALGVLLVAGCLAAPDSPAVPFGLTAVMARHRAGAGDVVEALIALRGALVEAGDLDAASEPVPLVVAEPAKAALSLAAYLRELLERAAAVTGTDRDTVAARALELMGSR